MSVCLKSEIKRQKMVAQWIALAITISEGTGKERVRGWTIWNDTMNDGGRGLASVFMAQKYHIL